MYTVDAQHLLMATVN